MLSKRNGLLLLIAPDPVTGIRLIGARLLSILSSLGAASLAAWHLLCCRSSSGLAREINDRRRDLDLHRILLVQQHHSTR